MSELPIHLLVFPTCLEWSPIWDFSGYVHHPVTRPASPLKLYSDSTVTMASHTSISVSATLGMVISSLDYAQNHKAPVPLMNYVHCNRVVPQGVQLSYTHGDNDMPLELVLKRVFPRNIHTVLKKLINPETEPNLGHLRRQLFCATTWMSGGQLWREYII